MKLLFFRFLGFKRFVQSPNRGLDPRIFLDRFFFGLQCSLDGIQDRFCCVFHALFVCFCGSPMLITQARQHPELCGRFDLFFFIFLFSFLKTPLFFREGGHSLTLRLFQVRFCFLQSLIFLRKIVLHILVRPDLFPRATPCLFQHFHKGIHLLPWKFLTGNILPRKILSWVSLFQTGTDIGA